MPPRNLVRAFFLLWYVLGAGLLIGSILTVRSALGTAHGPNPHIALLGGVEAVAALLFLIPRTLRLGAAGLLLTLGVAFLLHAVHQQFRWDLLVYAAAVIFVAVHGPVSLTGRALGSGAPESGHPSE